MATSSTALLLIDIQSGFDDHPAYWGKRSNPEFEANVTRLLEAFRSASPKVHIIHVHHLSKNSKSPLAMGAPGVAPQPYVLPLPTETVITKHENSGFINTNLEEIIRQRGVSKLYVCGLTTGECVSTTIRMAANLHVCDRTNDAGEILEGEIILVGDATAAHELPGFDAELVQKLHEATLKHEFCGLVSTYEAVNQISGR